MFYIKMIQNGYYYVDVRTSEYSTDTEQLTYNLIILPYVHLLLF